MKLLHAFIVMPCLNEEITLAATCRSLGFFSDVVPTNATLVIVDNGSTDATLKIASDIQMLIGPDRVIIASEAERGYVPPRHRGVMVAKARAKQRCLDEAQVLILQVDADTIYSDGYIFSMLEAARNTPYSSLMLKARTTYPSAFIAAHRRFFDLCSTSDAPFEFLLTDHPDDIIIDDKACGFLLVDYFRWGGHRREFTIEGEEIHSETTRLFMRALFSNCHTLLVEDAVACHSVRKVIDNPIIEFITAGCPREAIWLNEHRSNMSELNSLDSFLSVDVNNDLFKIAVRLRQTHVLGLFGVLPLSVARTLNLPTNLALEPWATNLKLPHLTPEDLLNSPGRIIIEALAAAEKLFIPS